MQLVYKDDLYKITKKGGEDTGTIDAPFDLLDIALRGFENEEMPVLLYKKDFCEIMDKAIHRIQQLKEKYPEDKK